MTIQDGTERQESSQVWMHAAVVGGFWASFEIIIGSFLHNLRVPLAGSLLTMLGIIFLIAFHRYWPIRGLIWRAGVICALMKSVSPSAVILGPMTGIFSEAIVMELIIYLMGRTRTAYTIGAIMVMFVTLIHKIITLLIYYGFNLVLIFDNFYQYTSNQLKLGNSNSWNLLGLIFLVYALLGIISAVIAFRITGIKTGSKYSLPDTYKKVKLQNKFSLSLRKDYSRFFLFLHLMTLPAGMYFLNNLPLYWAAGIVVVYILFCIFYYRGILKRLERPALWIQLFGVILFASFFIDNISNSQDGISLYGFLEGLEMSVRAIFVFIGFSAISIEIRNPIVKTFLVNRGFRNLYNALSLAFGVLPLMVERLSSPSRFLRQPGVAMAEMIGQAENWLELIKEE